MSDGGGRPGGPSPPRAAAARPPEGGAYECDDHRGNRWRVARDESPLRLHDWVLYKNGVPWVECATRADAMNELLQRCDGSAAPEGEGS